MPGFSFGGWPPPPPPWAEQVAFWTFFGVLALVVLFAISCALLRRELGWLWASALGSVGLVAFLVLRFAA